MGGRVDTPAFKERLALFVAEEYPALLRTAYLLAGDVEAAKDLAQAALARTCAKGLEGTRIDDLGAYLYRCMVNAQVSASRRRWRGEQPTATLPDRPKSDVELERVPEREALRTALRSLPPRQRAALVLRYYADLSEAQTAAVLGCPPGTVKTLTARGLAAVRQRVHDVSTMQESLVRSDDV